jgi:hypothetical protein
MVRIKLDIGKIDVNTRYIAIPALLLERPRCR